MFSPRFAARFAVAIVAVVLMGALVGTIVYAQSPEPDTSGKEAEAGDSQLQDYQYRLRIAAQVGSNAP